MFRVRFSVPIVRLSASLWRVIVFCVSLAISVMTLWSAFSCKLILSLLIRLVRASVIAQLLTNCPEKAVAMCWCFHQREIRSYIKFQIMASLNFSSCSFLVRMLITIILFAPVMSLTSISQASHVIIISPLCELSSLLFSTFLNNQIFANIILPFNISPT